MTIILNISLTNEEKNIPLTKYRIEFWCEIPKKEDLLLGKATTDKEGKCILKVGRTPILLTLKQLSFYFKIYNGKEFILYKTENQVDLQIAANKFNLSVELAIKPIGADQEDFPNRRLFGKIQNVKGENLSGVVLQIFEQYSDKEERITNQIIRNGYYAFKYVSKFPNAERKGITIKLKLLSPEGKVIKELAILRSREARQEINLIDLNYPPRVVPTIKTYIIKGVIKDAKGAVIPSVMVELFNQNIPGRTEEITSLGNPVISCENGTYEIKVDHEEIQEKCQKVNPDITLKVSDENGKELFTTTNYNTAATANLELVIPKDLYVGQSVFDKLNHTITPHLEGLAIKDIREDEEVKGVTFLAEKTKLSTVEINRSVAAHRFKAEAKADIPVGFYFSLFKNGVRTNKDVLYRTNVTRAIDQYEKAVADNVIADEGKNRVQIKTAFIQESVQHILSSKPPLGASTMDDMLSLSLTNEKDKKRFVEIYYHSEGDHQGVWNRMQEKLGKKKTKQLQLEGKMGYLTLNNAPLIKKLKDKKAFKTTPLDLVKKGYFNKAKWNDLIEEDRIPEAFTGATITERKEKYTDWLTQQLIRSYPTKVIAERIKINELKVSSNAAIKKEVYNALYEDSEGFELGTHSVNKHIQSLEAKGTTLTKGTKGTLKKIHRVYQLSPNESTMQILLDRGLDSAFKITNYDQERFLKKYQADFGDDEKIALQVYNKAVADASLVTNLTMSYLTQRNNPLPAAVAPMIRNSPEASVKKYPTIENLFGSLDYCSCGHCESILSPAAYFVELLEFLNVDLNNDEDLDNDADPQTVLFERRPDLEYTQLTCENTNTVLPYIDLVNEILEHYIVNSNSLDSFEGHNIEAGTPSEELMASPQFVKEEAYDILKEQVYPLTAPFNRHLELLRAYFNKLEVPLHEAMEALRKNNQLNDDTFYGWQQIFAEQLNISPQEHAVLTDHVLGGSGDNTIRQLYGLTDTVNLNDTIANAQTFCRAVDIPYADLVRILKTTFINHGSILIPKLEKLQTLFNKSKEDIEEVQTIYGNKNLFQILQEINEDSINQDAVNLIFPEEAYDGDAFDGNVKTWINNTYADIVSIIFLVPLGTDIDMCQFENFELKYADTNNADLADIEYWKLMRFIRLKNKLALSYEDTDRIIQALYDFDNFDFSGGDLELFDKGFTDLLIRIALLFRIEKMLKLNRRKDFEQLLLFWGDLNLHTYTFVPPTVIVGNTFPAIGAGVSDIRNNLPLESRASTQARTTNVNAQARGTNNNTQNQPQAAARSTNPENNTATSLPPSSRTGLYRTSFNRVADLSIDQTFQANPQGKFLTDTSKKLNDYISTVQGAIKINKQEFANLGGRIKFYPTHTATATSILDFFDIPLSVENVSILFRHSFLAKALKISVEELLDLIDLLGIDPFDNLYINSGNYIEPNLLKFIRLAQNIKSSDLEVQDLNFLLRHQDATGNASPKMEEVISLAQTITDQLKTIDKEYQVTSELTEEKTKALFTLIYGADLTELIYATLNNRTDIQTKVDYTHGEPTLENNITTLDNRLTYNDLEHTLSFVGVMPLTIRDDFKAIDGVSNIFKNAIDNLYDAGQETLKQVFDAYPEIKNLYDAIHITETESETTPLSIIQNYLQPILFKLKSKTIEETLSSQLSISSKHTNQLLNTTVSLDNDFLLHANNNLDKPAAQDFLDIHKNGISIQYSNNEENYQVASVPQINWETGVMTPFEGTFEEGNPTEITWRFYLQAPNEGNCNIYFETDAAFVQLKIDGNPVSLIKQDEIWENTQAIELISGQYHFIEIKAFNIADKAILKWQTVGTLIELIPATYLYPYDLMMNFKHTYFRMLKTIRMIDAMHLTPKEVLYFGERDVAIHNLAFPNAFPLSLIETESINTNLLNRLKGLLEYKALKEKLSIEEDSLIDVLINPDVENENGNSILFKITNWNKEDYDYLLTHFSNVPNLTNKLYAFHRMVDAFKVLNKIGSSAKDIVVWTTTNPDAIVTAEVHRMLKSKYDENGWLTVLEPINNKMRDHQRDAMVNYVIKVLSREEATQHIDTPDKLFEYFLIDVQMEPCMKTSRIKQAISTVQLFIDRCFMNLEATVDSSVLSSRQWEWMSRYRVWEASKKIFLHPENWLNGSLRNTKSPFYKEFESELLQSDINNDLARTALLNYLEKLDKVAWLEICGMCKEDEERIHVIGHTSGMNREYYHRVYDGTWSPWEKVDLDFEDESVFPIFWKGRLFLFWITVIQKGLDGNQIDVDSDPEDLTSIKGNSKRTVEINLNWSEFYNGKWQPKRTSDFNNPWSFEVSYNFISKNIFLDSYINEENYLVIYLNTFYSVTGDDDSKGRDFIFFNKFSSPLHQNHDRMLYYSALTYRLRHHWNQDKFFNVSGLEEYDTRKRVFDIRYLIDKDNDGYFHLNDGRNEVVTKNPLLNLNSWKARIFNQNPVDLYDAPLFFIDKKHVFFIKPTLDTHTIEHSSTYGTETISD